MKKFPKIGQLKHALYNLAKCETDTLKLEYQGAVKLHGTNAGIYVDDNTIQCQGRNRTLTPIQDNYGFAFAMGALEDEIRATATAISPNPLTLYGEWCGKGIQAKVAVSELDKRLVLFWAYDHFTNEWLLPVSDYFDVLQPSYSITVPLGEKSEVIETLDLLTLRVESRCPYAFSQGADGIGEGIVWTPVDGERRKNTGLWFKTKGGKHQGGGAKRVRVAADPAILSAAQEFADFAVDEARIAQAIFEVKPTSMADTGTWLKWVNQDVLAECELDLRASNLEWKQVAKRVTCNARNALIKYLSSC